MRDLAGGRAMGRGSAAALALLIGSIAVGAPTVSALEGPGRRSAANGSGGAAIVAMGDSFISGEGGRWMGNGSESSGTRSGTDRAAFGCGASSGCRYDPRLVYGASEENGCHRSDVAPIASAPIAAQPISLACSGARAENIWPAAAGGQPLRGESPQADQLAAVAGRWDVRLIVLTVGANDVGFGGLVIRCALDWAGSSTDDPRYCHRSAQADIEAALPAMRRGLARTIAQIRAVMWGAGYRRGDYRLAVMAYASPFPDGSGIRYPETGWSRLNEGGCPLWDADANWAARQATPALASAMRAVAGANGAEFLDLQHALDGHRVCDRGSSRAGAAGPSPLAAEWVRRLDFQEGSVRESLHPNAYGQRAIGACIGLLYARPPGEYACHDSPSRGYVDGMRLESLR